MAERKGFGQLKCYWNLYHDCQDCHRCRARKVIYESAPAVNPEFESLAAPAAPLVTGLDTLLPSRLEDKATLESDLSAAPEAEMGWGLEKVPGLPIGVS